MPDPQYSTVTDSAILPAWGTMVPRGVGTVDTVVDITPIFEDGLGYGGFAAAGYPASAITIGNAGSVEFDWQPADQQGVMDLGSLVLFPFTFNTTRLSRDVDHAGIWYDLDTERDSVFVTWNGATLSGSGSGMFFQMELHDIGNGDAEIILRFEDTPYLTDQPYFYFWDDYWTSRLDFSTYVNPALHIDGTPGNTGVAGVWQFLMVDGVILDPFDGAPPPHYGLDEQTGTEGPDLLTGSIAMDLITGLGGNDTIDGQGANDTLFGDDGNDVLHSGSGHDIVWGGNGNDLIDSPMRDDPGFALNDHDRFYGGGGDDTLLSGWSPDTLAGNAGNDHIEAGVGRDLVYGGAGNDYVLGGPNEDTIHGGTGNDTLIGGSETGDWWHGRPGGQSDWIYGDDGDDVINGGGGFDHLFGGAGNDTIHGGTRGDVIRGEAGDDFLTGGLDVGYMHYNYSHDESDTLIGGEGADRFYASYSPIYSQDPRAYSAPEIRDYDATEGDRLVLNGAQFSADDLSLRVTMQGAAGETEVVSARLVVDVGQGQSWTAFDLVNLAGQDHLDILLPGAAVDAVTLYMI